MKKIDIKKLEKTKKTHWDYCKNLDVVSKLSDQDKKLLFIENPFTENFEAKEIYQEKYGNINLEDEYKKFRRYKKTIWNAIKLIEILEITVCPYCGMNYFSTIGKNSRSLTTVSLDHYLPKAEYKMLALNIYNLIPCCRNCNSTFKGNFNTPIINPYFYSLEENLRFKIEADNLSDFILNNKKKLKIGIENMANDETIKSLVKAHISTLSLNERYNYFHNIARSIIKKKIYYNNTYISELENFESLNLSKTDIEKILICEDIFEDNEPFLKFKKDIWEQLSQNRT